MIQITDEIYINKNQILYIKELNDYFEIVMTHGKYIVSEYSPYYGNIIDLLEIESGNNE